MTVEIFLLRSKSLLRGRCIMREGQPREILSGIGVSPVICYGVIRTLTRGDEIVPRSRDQKGTSGGSCNIFFAKSSEISLVYSTSKSYSPGTLTKCFALSLKTCSDELSWLYLIFSDRAISLAGCVKNLTMVNVRPRIDPVRMRPRLVLIETRLPPHGNYGPPKTTRPVGNEPVQGTGLLPATARARQ